MRIAAGRTLKDLADLLNVTVPYMSDIERGRRNPPSSQQIRQLSSYLGQPDACQRLEELAIESRGAIELRPQDEETSRLLVSLNRRLEDQSLDHEQVERILRILLEGRPDERR